MKSESRAVGKEMAYELRIMLYDTFLMKQLNILFFDLWGTSRGGGKAFKVPSIRH